MKRGIRKSGLFLILNLLLIIGSYYFLIEITQTKKDICKKAFIKYCMYKKGLVK